MKKQLKAILAGSVGAMSLGDRKSRERQLWLCAEASPPASTLAVRAATRAVHERERNTREAFLLNLGLCQTPILAPD